MLKKTLPLFILSFLILTIHAQIPTIDCPDDTTLYKNVICDAQLTYSITCASNCTGTTISQTDNSGYTSGNSFPIGVTFQEYTITSSSATSTCDFNVTVLDTIAPSIACIGTQTVSAITNCDAILSDYTSLITFSDNCDANPSLTQYPTVGTPIITYTEVTMTATDSSGNIDSCSFLVIVNDNQAPIVTCPADSNVFANDSCKYLLEDMTSFVVATDNCDSNLTIIQHPAVGNVFFGGDNPYISFDVSDIYGNVSVCSYRILVVDTVPPEITCPSNQSLYIDSSCSFVMTDYTYLAIGSDNCSANVIFSQTPIVGAIMNGADTTTVTLFATDILGNVDSCNFELFAIDTISPNIILCAPDTTVNVDSLCNYYLDDFSSYLITNDNCNGILNFSQNPSIGTQLLVGSVNSVTLNVLDESGNSSSCIFNLTVADISAPYIQCPSNSNVPIDTSCSYIIPDYKTLLNVYDNCDTNFTFSQSPNVGDTLSGVGTTQIISILANDIYGNSSSCSFSITLIDTTSPTIICPSNQYINLDSNCLYTVTDIVSLTSAFDYCDLSPIITQSIPVGSVTGGITQINLVATDNSGNTSTCTIDLYPNDTIFPIITCPDSISTCINPVYFVNPNATDDCSTVSAIQTDTTGLISGNNFPVGTTILTFSTSDLVGNTSTCNLAVEIYPPVAIDAGPDLTIEEGENIMIDATITGINILWTPNFYIDNVSIEDPIVSPIFSTTYYVTAESADGCDGIDSVIVFVTQVNDMIINNIVTPNGDGKNDTWNLNKPAAISACPVSIFNRWGKMVWQSSSYVNQWDGKNEYGDELPDGTYYYTIICRGDEYSGSIILIR